MAAGHPADPARAFVLTTSVWLVLPTLAALPFAMAGLEMLLYGLPSSGGHARSA